MNFSWRLLGFHAWISVESKLQHMEFMVLMMEQAGFNVELFPWMSDRGNLLAAATILLCCSEGISISIKYCLEHIIRNAVHKFKIGKDKLGRLCTILSAMHAKFELGEYL
jgi:hypothetical protein